MTDHKNHINFIHGFPLLILAALLICPLSASAQKKEKKKDKKDNEYPAHLEIWNLGSDYSPQTYDIGGDTLLHLFQVYDFADKRTISRTDLGNMGSPYISNIFEDRPMSEPAVFQLNNFYDYIRNPERTKYYKTNRPYTWLYYCTTPKSRNGQVLDFTHSQNVNEKLNWGFNIGLVGSTGRLSNQHARLVNFAPQASYIGKHLQIHFNYNFNKFSVQENGGIIDSVEVNPDRLQVKMENSDNLCGYRDWFFNVNYSLGKTDFKIINDSTRYEIYTPQISFNYNCDFQKQFRTYDDEDLDQSVYSDFFMSATQTHDSIFYSKFTNSFQVKFHENGLLKFSPMLRGEIGMESEKYYCFNNYLESQDNSTYQNPFFRAGISSEKTKNLSLAAEYKQYLGGYHSGDMEFHGKLGLKFYKGKSKDSVTYFNVRFDFFNAEPSYFEQNYNSNNFRWSNDFSKKQTTKVSAEFGIPFWHLRLGAAYFMLNNHIYFNENALPAQCGDAISVQSVSAQKDFFVWHVRFANRVTWQNTDHNDILNLPALALHHATYFEFTLCKKVLNLQTGGEVRYSTEYNAFGYCPATSVFYTSNRLKAGDYPIVNAFVNLKIKGVLMFFRWEHVNEGMIRDYYSAADNYPITDFHFNFGILWRFGD